MARNRPKRPHSTGPTRLSSALDHTVGYGGLGDFDSVSLADIREAFRIQDRPVRSPLIRTVRIEREPFYAPPRSGKRQSPTLAVRATFRSSDAPIRSPFKGATMVTPELTQRALECARRGIRREVLFATKRTGKGSVSPKKRYSKTRC